MLLEEKSGDLNRSPEAGRGSLADETDVDVDASWQTTNDDDGKLEFRDVYKGVTLDPVAVGNCKKEGT